ncbi:hypothetical protein [Kitasatospora herbaricolor]|uniref:DUF8175 domain-containing protein n=1 Tax=Kitasatospora herbaricolor TaxID=68217 RepID=A0ABZ1W0N5_9ACTN|nr:hypothetical protein [Kitasatospora herbaricolor]
MPRRENGGGTRVLKDDEPAKKSPSPLRGPVLVIGAIVLVLILGAIFISRGPDSGTAPDNPAPSGKASDVAGGSSLTGASTPGQTAASRLVEGVPVGYSRSREGAVAAAVNYEIARSSARYLTDSGSRERILKTIMASDAAAGQIKDDNTAGARFYSALGLTADTADKLIARASPLGSKVVSYSPEVATVSVWMSGIVGLPTPNAPVPVSASWTTYTLVLVWRDGDWKTSSISVTPGPTPLQSTGQQPTSTDVFTSMDKEFDAPPYVG